MHPNFETMKTLNNSISKLTQNGVYLCITLYLHATSSFVKHHIYHFILCCIFFKNAIHLTKSILSQGSVKNLGSICPLAIRNNGRRSDGQIDKITWHRCDRKGVKNTHFHEQSCL